MITIVIKDIELYDNASEEFVMAEGGTFRFEHSLEAIADWESRWKIPFLNSKLTNAQLMDYYKTMCLDKGFTKAHLTPDAVELLAEYMGDPFSATTFRIQNENKFGIKPILTSEVLYSMMVAAEVPFECARWNINRLITLLRIVSDNKTEKKPMSQSEILAQNRKLNAERRAKFNTKG